MDEAKKFIRASKDQPFFCYLPVTPPHGMFDIPDSDPAWKLYADKPWPLEARRYAAMVSMVDRQVGELRLLLQELGVADKTLIVFSGDNGGNDYFPSREHPKGIHGANVNPSTGVVFRGKKGTLYEGGLRVPMIVHWPGQIEAGRVSDLLCYFPDMLPTLAELAGAKAPADIDGISLVPELIGEAKAGRKQPQHDYLYWELNQQTAIRQGNWKAVQPKDKAWELYDLSSDVSEQHNLAVEKPDVLARLKSLAQAAHQPAIEGTFHNREIHERDRQAKWGDTQPQ
jgi:arylsulfatase A-like enzyme